MIFTTWTSKFKRHFLFLSIFNQIQKGIWRQRGPKSRFLISYNLLQPIFQKFFFKIIWKLQLSVSGWKALMILENSDLLLYMICKFLNPVINSWIRKISRNKGNFRKIISLHRKQTKQSIFGFNVFIFTPWKEYSLKKNLEKDN